MPNPVVWRPRRAPAPPPASSRASFRSASRIRWPGAAVALMALMWSGPAGGADPFDQLVGGNGHAPFVFNAEVVRDGVASAYIDRLHDHPWQRWSPVGPDARDLVQELYFGFGDADSGRWARERADLRALDYLAGTGIVAAEFAAGEAVLTTYCFSPMGLDAPALVLIAHVLDESGLDRPGARAWLLVDLAMGDDDGSGRRVGGERATWDAAAGALIESSMTEAGAAVVWPLSTLSGIAMSPQDARAAVESGDAFQGTVDSGVRDDVVAALAFEAGAAGMEAGGEAWVGAVVALTHDSDTASLLAAVQGWADEDGPEALLERELAFWDDFHAREPVPPALDADGLAVLRQQSALLALAQVREEGEGAGQIPASAIAAAPVSGATHVWNITWVRDAAYATVGLARACHLDEARASLDFLLRGTSSLYQDWVGRPYAVSVCRTTGDGTEESDWNEFGPNVEFDDFGLFLWAFAEVVDRAPDLDFAEARYAEVADGVAEPIVALVDDTGLVAPDSSVWEVHWYGRQKHFTWTSLWAAAGLRRLAGVADRLGQASDAARYREVADGIARAIADLLVDEATGVLAGNLEEMAGGLSQAMDAATVEAFNQGVVDPGGPVALATLTAYDDWLATAGGGYFRNDDGDVYDRHEWVVLDLRIARALAVAGRTEDAEALLGRVLGLARANHDLLPELYDPDTSDYAGPVPMNGFGAGALWVTATDGLDLSEALPCPEATPGETDGPGEPGEDTDGEGGGGCSCGVAPDPTGWAGRGPDVPGVWSAGLAAFWVYRRRRPPVGESRRRPSGAFLAGMGGLVAVVTGCAPPDDDCTAAPILEGSSQVTLDPDSTTRLSLEYRQLGDTQGAVAWSVTGGDRVAAVVDGDLALTPRPGWTGSDRVRLTATNTCGATSLDLEVTVRELHWRTCGTTFRYTPSPAVTSVTVAGSWNGWDPAATPLERRWDGSYDAVVELEPGAWPYKFVLHEAAPSSEGGQWTCDPEATQWQCDAGYTWNEQCEPGGAACNSMRLVTDCQEPRLELASLTGDRAGGEFHVQVRGVLGAGRTPLDAASLRTTAGGALATDAVWDGIGGTLSLSRTGLSPGKHSVRVEAVDAARRTAEPLFVPLWTGPTWDWRQAALYYPFVDRFQNGDPSNDGLQGVEWPVDYHGGDWAGVEQRLDYLGGMGITAIWLSPPQDNPDGGWPGTCNRSYTGYHGYWPQDPVRTEEHFGTEDDLKSLIAAAHERGIRILVDFAANHVHQDHPYYRDHAQDGWFNDPWICGEDDGWNLAPETCWFDEFLPDVDYTRPEPLARFVQDGMDWIRDYDLDGFRIDAVKHMPHSFHADLRARIRSQVEHDGVATAGLVDPFWLVGETFTGDWGLIGDYVGDGQLSGQFDFPLYYAILQAFARREIDLLVFEDTAVALREAWGLGALMSNFLGNHDVDRYIGHAAGQVANLWGTDLCDGDGDGWPASAGTVTDPAAYDRLIQAWAFLFTWEGIPLVYYGDEYGAPGFHDPDNRQDFRDESELSPDQARVLAAVRTLGTARQAHDALWRGSRNTFWRGAEQWCTSRVYGSDAAVVCFNRADSPVTLANGLSWAGLPFEGAYRDLLSGAVATPDGDSITLELPAVSATVWVHEP